MWGNRGVAPRIPIGQDWMEASFQLDDTTAEHPTPLSKENIQLWTE